MIDKTRRSRLDVIFIGVFVVFYPTKTCLKSTVLNPEHRDLPVSKLVFGILNTRLRLSDKTSFCDANAPAPAGPQFPAQGRPRTRGFLGSPALVSVMPDPGLV